MRLLKTASVISSAFVAAASAIPALQGMLPREISELLEKRGVLGVDGDILQDRSFHHEVEIVAHQDDWAGFRLAGCDLSVAQLPKPGGNSSTLPDPDSGLKLTRVVLGIGTQNYTCSSAGKLPELIGELAIFYDASCLAEYSPSLLHELPHALVQVPHKNIYTLAVFTQRFFNLEKNPDTPHKHESLISGHGFSLDGKTPVFDYRSSSTNHDEIMYGSIKNSVSAPEEASKGRFGHAYGAIDWIQLVSKQDYPTVGFKMAYRVVTAGGKPPSTCNGFGDHIEIPYVAEYWLYN